MSILSTLAYYRTAVFYYILGGFTFLPLCAAIVFVHFWLTAPPYEIKTNVEDLGEIIGEGELSEERKRQALDLAIWNQKAEKEVQERKGKESEEESTSTAIPGSARRVNPPLPQKRPHRAGWLTVRRHFQNDGVNLALKDAAQQAAKRSNAQAAKAAAAATDNGTDAKSQGYMSSVYKSMLNFRNKDPAKGPVSDVNRGQNTTSDKHSGSSTPEQIPEDRPQANISTTSKNGNYSIAAAQASAAKETFYCILKGPILYLYSSADPSNPETECHAAIDLRGKRISIYVAHEGDTMGEPNPESSSEAVSTNTSTDSLMTRGQDKSAKKQNNKRARVRDGELFVKRNAIRIVSMGGPGLIANEKIRFAEWFVFAKNAYQLEDWYHAFISASLLPEGLHADHELDLIGSVFSNEDMTNLLANLDNVPDPIPLRWLNAMVGRIFFSIYKTAWLEDYITHKFRKKISRVRTPGFLSDIRVREIDLGHTAPAFSRPMLKSLTGDGEASMEVSVHYRGSLRLTISTVLTISLGSRFKQYNVSLVLAVILNSLEGNLLLHIKPPPSNRLWFGFTKLPTMDISVEPVVSERKVQWSMVKRLIEGRIRELLTESLVVPNMDDIPFFDTRSFDQRGGIWSHAAKGAQRIDLNTVTNDDQPTFSADLDTQRQSKSTPASVLNLSTDDTLQGSSSAVSTNDVKHLRNRGMTGEASHSESALLSTSLAAAGLSSLLARDQAAASSAGSTSTGAGKAPSKRRSWFVGRSNSPTRAHGGRKSNLQHSSLAWGSASLSTGDDALTHERNKPSISSSIGEQGNDTDTSAAESQLDAHESDAYAESDHADLPESQHEDDIPAVHIQGMEVEEEGEGEDFNDAMFTAKAEHFNESSEDTALAHKQSQTPDVGPTPPPPAAAVAPPSIPPRPPIKTTGSSSFLPPPSRSARPSSSSSGLIDQEQQRSPAMQSLASIQKERYSGTPVQANTAEEAHSRSAATQAALLHGWNKAKASMADRDSRQAAAKEAKDAFKRGWANWNAKRSGHNQSSTGVDTILTSSDRLGESGPSRSSTITTPSSETGWLASSPEDPASLGVGFDGHGLTTSPSILSLDNNRTQDETLTPTSSRASSIAGRRQPYREHRADRLKKEIESNNSLPSSRASSIHSFDQSALQPPPVPARENDDGESTPIRLDEKSNLTSQEVEKDAWDAETPSVAAPVPAAHRDSHLEGRNSLSSSPVTVRRSNIPPSGSPTNSASVTLSSSADGQGKPSYFLPGQATATIGLSGMDLPSLTTQDIPSAQVAVPVRAKEGESTEIRRRNSSTSGSRESQVATSLSPDRRVSSTSMTTQELPQAGSPDTGATTTSPIMQPKGIKQQPIRATMMTVPGIPSMQKAGPQSFEAPKPIVEASPKGRTSNIGGASDPALVGGSPRLGLGNLISRIPSFGSASMAGQTESIAAPFSESGVDASEAGLPSVSSVHVDDAKVTPALNHIEYSKNASEAAKDDNNAKNILTDDDAGIRSTLQSAVDAPNSAERVQPEQTFSSNDYTSSSKRPVPIPPPAVPQRIPVAERLESTVKSVNSGSESDRTQE